MALLQAFSPEIWVPDAVAGEILRRGRDDISARALSGLLWGGNPGRLIDAAETGTIELVNSVPLLSELKGVLSREKFAKQLARRGLGVDDRFDGHVDLVVVVKPAIVEPTIIRDPADHQVLAAAVVQGLTSLFPAIRI